MTRDEFKPGAEVFLVSLIGGIFCRRVVRIEDERVVVVGPDDVERHIYADGAGAYPTYSEYQQDLFAALSAVRGPDGSPWPHDTITSPGSTTMICPTDEVEQTRVRMEKLGWILKRDTTVSTRVPDGLTQSVLTFRRKEMEDGS